MIRKAAVLTLITLVAVWAIGGYAKYVTTYVEQLLGGLFLSIALYKGWLFMGAKKAKYESFLLFLFIFSFLAGTVAANANKIKSIQVSVRLASYSFIFVSMVGMKISTREAYKIVKTFLLSLSAICVVSLLSYFQIYESYITNGLIYEKSNLVGIKGPFVSRTAISRYLSLSLPVIFLVGSRKKSNRYLMIASSITLYVSSVLTHSRGVYLCLAYILIVYLYKNIRTKKTNRKVVYTRYIPFTLAASVLVFAFLGDDKMQDVLRRIRMINPEHIAGQNADMFRLVALRKTLEDLVTAPFGLGSTGVYSEQKGIMRNPHNTLTVMVRSAGIMGALTFAGVMISALFRYKRSKKTAVQLFLVTSVFSALIYGMTHGNLNNLGFWLFYGILVSLCLGNEKERKT